MHATLTQRGLFCEYENEAKPGDDRRTVESCLQPLIDRQPESLTELERQRLVDCMAGFPCDAIEGAVALHLEQFGTDTYFISRRFLVEAATRFAGRGAA